jgi:electron transfer flavoprotein alpha subunit
MAHILCFVEVRESQVRKASLEAVSVARGLATANGWSVEAAVLGPAGADQLDKVKAAGADTIHHAADAALALYSPDLYAAALLGLIQASKPEAVLLGHTAMGRDLSAYLAGKLKTAVAGDAVKVEFAGGFKVVRPMYAGKALATVSVNAGFLPLITLRPNIFPVGSTAGKGEVKPLALPSLAPKTLCAGLEKPESAEIDVAEADVIVSGGRAMKGPENFAILKELAAELGAAVGASRAAVDSGWIGHPHQVGQTGKTVSPNLYIACGISGAIQHLAGMSSSKIIVAINKDKEAPIFQAADYGVLGDLFQIVPQVTRALKDLKKEG